MIGEVKVTYQFTCAHEHCFWTTQEMDKDAMYAAYRSNGSAPDDQHFLDTGHTNFTMTKKEITPAVIVDPKAVRRRLLSRKERQASKTN